MNRRAFLSTLSATIGAGIVSATLDPERLLWVPGAKTIFVPPPRELTVFQLNQYEITRRCLEILRANLVYADRMYRQYDRQFISS